MKNRYEIIDHDVWGNKVDGFTVNNSFRTGTIIELNDNATDKDIIKALKDCAFLRSGLHVKSFEIDGDLEYSLYVNCINQAHGGWYPVCELQRV